MFTTIQLEVDKLQIGMYVAQLDRPWLETPFLFQGFYIRSNDEIDELKKHCQYVLVDRESIPESTTLSSLQRSLKITTNGTHSGQEKRRFRLFSLFKRKNKEPPRVADSDHFESTGTFYRNTKSLKQELASATTLHANAVTTLQTVMQDMQSTDRLDMQRLTTTVTPMVKSVLRNPAALAHLVRLQKKGEYLYHHSLASSVWATILGRHIGLSRDDLNVIALGAMLLDIGKTRIPDEILKKPGSLSEQELNFMRRHVEFGLDILHESGDVDSRVLDMVAHHHERFNGTGYPEGRKGNEIPVFGRIAGIVDAYDAMISKRPYAEPMSSFDALRTLRVLADVEFQEEMVDQFTQAIGVFPTGTLVELNTGEVAVVTGQNRIRRLRPEVMVITDANKNLIDSFRVIDLNKTSVAASGRDSLWIERGLAPGSHGIDPTEFFLD